MEQRSRIKVKPISNGIAILLPGDDIYIPIEQEKELKRVGSFSLPIRLLWRSLFAFVAILLFGIVGFLIWTLLLIVESWEGFFCVLLFIIILSPFVKDFLYLFFGKETIVVSEGRIILEKVLFGIKIRKKHYEMYDIKGLRLAPGKKAKKGPLLFKHGTQVIRFGKHIDEAEASILLKHLSDIMKFHCHSVEHIIFGTSSLNNTDPYTTSHNPDVSDLTFPFVHLKQVVIHTETYDFHLVERFLTYAVNYIGQDYLKKHVEVAVYGDPEKLHPNLRNSFDNLCKRVQVNKELTK